MKVLTIKQPYASLIAEGYKEYEFRSWKSSYRGELYIHAGLGMDKEAMKKFEYLHLDYPQGKIIAKCNMVDCILIDDKMKKVLKEKNQVIYEKTINIESAMDYTTNIPKLKSTKSIAGKRIIPILEQDLKFFERTIEDLKEEEHLLRMSNGNPLSNNSYRQLWDSIKRRMRKTAKEMRLEIPDDLTSRICRHEYSIKIMNLTDREQMYLMGHEDISTTMKNYQTINVEHINRKELNKISKIKNGSLSSAKNK